MGEITQRRAVVTPPPLPPLARQANFDIFLKSFLLNISHSFSVNFVSFCLVLHSCKFCLALDHSSILCLFESISQLFNPILLSLSPSVFAQFFLSLSLSFPKSVPFKHIFPGSSLSLQQADFPCTLACIIQKRTISISKDTIAMRIIQAALLRQFNFTDKFTVCTSIVSYSLREYLSIDTQTSANVRFTKLQP